MQHLGHYHGYGAAARRSRAGSVGNGNCARVADLHWVKWAWISLPALVILFSVVFLGATAFCSVRAGMVEWSLEALGCGAVFGQYK
jgi:hypothetical protein